MLCHSLGPPRNSINPLVTDLNFGTLYEVGPSLISKISTQLLERRQLPESLGEFVNRDEWRSWSRGQRKLVCTSYHSLPIQQTLGQFHQAGPEFVIATSGDYAVYLKHPSFEHVEGILLAAQQPHMLMIPSYTSRAIVPLSTRAHCVILGMANRCFESPWFPSYISALTPREHCEPAHSPAYLPRVLRTVSATEKFTPCQMRLMCRSDLPEVLEIAKHGSEHPWSENDFIRHLRRGDTFGIVAESAGVIIGFLVYRKFAHVLGVLNLVVQKDSRRAGIGTQLLQVPLDRLPFSKWEALVVLARETNLGGQLFLKSRGLIAGEVIRNFFQDTREDAFAMSWAVRRHVTSEQIVSLAS